MHLTAGNKQNTDLLTLHSFRWWQIILFGKKWNPLPASEWSPRASSSPSAWSTAISWSLSWCASSPSCMSYQGMLHERRRSSKYWWGPWGCRTLRFGEFFFNWNAFPKNQSVPGHLSVKWVHNFSPALEGQSRGLSMAVVSSSPWGVSS